MENEAELYFVDHEGGDWAQICLIWEHTGFVKGPLCEAGVSNRRHVLVIGDACK